MSRIEDMAGRTVAGRGTLAAGGEPTPSPKRLPIIKFTELFDEFGVTPGDLQALVLRLVDRCRPDIIVIDVPKRRSPPKQQRQRRQSFSQWATNPVSLGVVASLNRSGRNVTGITFFGLSLGGKRFGLLHELVPNADLFAILVNPNNPAGKADITDMQAAAGALGQKLLVVMAGSKTDLETAFATFVQQRVGALIVQGDPSFDTWRDQILMLARLHTIPACYFDRIYVAAGGLMSYGSNVADAYRQAGQYAGRILHGDRPENLPVQQSTKIELTINMKTAKALGVTFPLTLLGRAER